MRDDTSALIEQWFSLHSNDGEFICSDRSTPYRVIASRDEGGHIVFVTKWTAISIVIARFGLPSKVGLIAKVGLPDSMDINWISNNIGSRKFVFLGDMDPSDLLVFAWLRARLHPTEVQLLGISDSYLDALDIHLQDSFIIDCTPAECEAIPTLHTALPDYADIIGPKCASLLRIGRKIELEAVVSAKGVSKEILKVVHESGR